MRSDEKNTRKSKKANKKEGMISTGVSVVMYILSAVMLAAAIFMLCYSISSMTQQLDAYGLKFAEVKFDVIQTVITAFLPYLAYSAILFGIGKAVSAMKNTAIRTADEIRNGLAACSAKDDSRSAVKTSQDETPSEKTGEADEDAESDNNR